MASPQGSDPSVRPWRLLSSHGLLLFYISMRPGCTVDDVSDGLSLTQRTVYSVVGDLRQAGFIDVRREGRVHHYSVNYGATVGHSFVPGGAELRHVLRLLANRTLAFLEADDGARSLRRSQEDTELKQRGA